MASFTPPEPPFEPDEPTPPPTLSVPLPPPEVGEGSPWAPADSENRDRILDWWRMWFRRVFFPWIAAFITYWDVQWNRLATYINTWIAAAGTYISEHAIAGYGFRPTATDIASAGTTDVVFTNVDAEHRPVVVGDLALDESIDGNFGIVTVVIDATHATVQYLGSLRGLAGYSWRITATPIAPEGTTNVLLVIDTVRPFALGDLVLDTAPDGNYGNITALIDATHVTVTYQGSLIGPQGIQGVPGAPGTNGTNGADGIMHSIVAGENIAVDSTDPANPIVSATGAGSHFYTDPAVMNSDALVLSNGSIGVLTVGSTSTSTSSWILTEHIWGNGQFSFESNDPSVWEILIADMDLGSNTNILMDGATAVEAVNGSHPFWEPRIGMFTQDPAQNRFLVLGPAFTPAGSSLNIDNSVALVANIHSQLTAVPDFDNDDTDSYEMHLWGSLAGNGQVNLRFCDGSTDSEQDTDASHYMAFGETLQYNAGVLTHDPDFVDPIGTVTHWSLANDTTGSPTFVDIILRVYHNSSAEGAPGGNPQPVIGYLESVFFDSPNGPISVMFKRTGTFYYYGNDVVRRGIFLLFQDEGFTGTLTMKAI